MGTCFDFSKHLKRIQDNDVSLRIQVCPRIGLHRSNPILQRMGLESFHIRSETEREEDCPCKREEREDCSTAWRSDCPTHLQFWWLNQQIECDAQDYDWHTSFDDCSNTWFEPTFFKWSLTASYWNDIGTKGKRVFIRRQGMYSTPLDPRKFTAERLQKVEEIARKIESGEGTTFASDVEWRPHHQSASQDRKRGMGISNNANTIIQVRQASVAAVWILRIHQNPYPTPLNLPPPIEYNPRLRTYFPGSPAATTIFL